MLQLLLTLLGQRRLDTADLLPAPAEDEVSQSNTHTDSQSVSQIPPAVLLIYLWYPLLSGVLCLNPSSSSSTCWVPGGDWLLACSVSSCRVRKRTSGWVWNRTLLAPPPVGWGQRRESINRSITVSQSTRNRSRLITVRNNRAASQHIDIHPVWSF